MKKIILFSLFIFLSICSNAQLLQSGHHYIARSVSTNPYGPELITNGTFDSSTGWALSTGASISGGVLIINTASNYSSIVDRTSSIGIQLNHTYLIEFEIVSRTSGSVKFGLGNTSNGVYSIEYNSTGVKSFQLTQTNTSAPDDLVFFTWSSGANLTIDNVSIREVL